MAKSNVVAAPKAADVLSNDDYQFEGSDKVRDGIVAAIFAGGASEAAGGLAKHALQKQVASWTSEGHIKPVARNETSAGPTIVKIWLAGRATRRGASELNKNTASNQAGQWNGLVQFSTYPGASTMLDYVDARAAFHSSNDRGSKLHSLANGVFYVCQHANKADEGASFRSDMAELGKVGIDGLGGALKTRIDAVVDARILKADKAEATTLSALERIVALATQLTTKGKPVYTGSLKVRQLLTLAIECRDAEKAAVVKAMKAEKAEKAATATVKRNARKAANDKAKRASARKAPAAKAA